MARAPLSITIVDTAGNAVSGASITVKKRSDGTNATLYAAETGGTTTPNPTTTNAQGRPTAWADRGAYALTITGTGITTYTENWDAAPAADSSVDTLWGGPLLAAAAPAPSYSLTKPVGPNDGAEWIYPADTTNGVLWRFRYILARTRWEWVGGTPLYADVPTGETGVGISAAYGNLATVGPSIAVPFAGDYWLNYGFETDNGPGTLFMAPDGAGLTAADADAASFVGQSVTWVNSGGGNTVFLPSGHSSVRRLRKTLTAATLTAKYKTNAQFRARWLSLTPAFIT